MTEKLATYKRTVAIIMVVVLLVLSFMIIRPFLVAIIGAAVLAYIFYPLYRFLLKFMPKFFPGETIAALLTVFVAILIVLLPMVFISISLSDEIKDGYVFMKDLVQNQSLMSDMPSSVLHQFGRLEGNVRQVLLGMGNHLINSLQEIIQKIPSAMLNIFITIFSMYFFLKGGKNLYQFCQNILPLPEGRYKQILSRFDDISYSMIYGQIVVGIIQGILAWAAFFFLKVPNPVLWGFVTAIISIIPMLGAAMVWLPVVAYLAIQGYAICDYSKAITLLVYGTCVVSSIDNVIKPKLIGDRANIHPLIILFGIIGGIQLIGLPGILIGPMVLALFDVVMSIFREVV